MNARPPGRATDDVLAVGLDVGLRPEAIQVGHLLHSFPMAAPDNHTELPDAAPRVGVVDATLIETLAALTPEERLRLNDRMALTIQELRDGFAAAEPDHAARPAGGQRD
jgi:hypothetical protein